MNTPKSQKNLAQAPQHYIYDASKPIEVTALDNDIWLSQKDMAELFAVSVRTIGDHVNNVIQDDKLNPDSTIRKIRVVTEDNKSREVMHYNLDVIIPVGYRVGSAEASAFRRWANGIIQQYLTVGVVINQPLLESQAQLRRKSTISKYDKAGLGNAPELELLKARYENIAGSERLKGIISKVCDTPNYAQITNAEYLALFGMVAQELKTLLETKSIRDSLGVRQLQALTLAEGMLSDLLKVQSQLSTERIISAIDLIIIPIGNHLKAYSEMLGVDPVTGKPLLPKQ